MDADAAGEVWAEARSSQMLGAGLRNVKWGGGQQRNATNRYNIHTPLSQPDTGHKPSTANMNYPDTDLWFPCYLWWWGPGSWCAIIIIREQITTGHHQPNQVVWLHGQQFTTSIKCNLCNFLSDWNRGNILLEYGEWQNFRLRVQWMALWWSL